MPKAAVKEITIPPAIKGPNNTIPKGATCQEASTQSRGMYIPCGNPATAIIHHDRDGRGYYMCPPCAYHNIRNRGGKFEAGIDPTAVKEMNLEDRLKASLKVVNASLVPDEVIPPPEKEEEIVPQLTDIITDRAERLKLIRMIQLQLPLAEQEKAIKNARKPLVDGIKKILGKFQVSKAAWEGHIINYFTGKPRRSISESKLILALTKRGMQPSKIKEILEESIEVGNPIYTLRIRVAGAEEEE